MTQSTHYLGVTALMLAVLGLVLSSGRRRWLLLALSGIILLIGFGRNLPVLFKPMYEFMPMFNRFRVPGMIYSILPLMAALLAAEFLQLFLDDSRWVTNRPNKTKSGTAGGWLKHWPKITIIVFILLLLWIFAGGGFADSMRQGGAFIKDREAAQWGARYVEPLTTQSLDQLGSNPNFPIQLVNLMETRINLLRSSVMMGLLFIALIAGVIELRRRGKLKGEAAALLLVALITADLWITDLKFYHPAPRNQTEAVLTIDPVSRWLKGQEGDFRIAPLTRQDYGSNRFAAFGIQSLGGYQPAKLRIYNDLMETNVLFAPAVFSMLNARYLITDTDMSESGLPLAEKVSRGGQGQSVAYIHENPNVLPRAWFVKEIKLSESSAGLLTHMGGGEFNPAVTAWVYGDELSRFEDDDQPVSAGETLSSGSITDYQYSPHRISAKAVVDGPAAGLVVFSEIYYSPGWAATIDGVEAPIYRVNHILRAMVLPAGEHLIEMSAVSQAGSWGRLISWISGLLVVLLIGGGWLVGRRSS